LVQNLAVRALKMIISPLELKRIYERTPHWLKELSGLVCSRLPPLLIYGREFIFYKKFLEKSQWWSKEQLTQYQITSLRRLIDHAYQNVPYYRRILIERNLTPAKFSSLADLRKLPLLTKEIIQEHFEDLIAKNIPRRAMKLVTTGGTSNNQLRFYIEKETSLKEWAFMTTQWERVNFRLDDKRLVLRGRPIDPCRNDGLWEYDPLTRECRLSVYHLTEENLFKYVEVMKKFSPDFIHGYPSAVAIFAQFIIENKIKNLPPIKGVLCGSEAILDHQKKLIEKAFKTRLFTWYGQSEKAILAGECETNSCYHIFPEYGITELVDENGNQITEPNQMGELVGTGFINYAMPLIRYKTGDLASFEQGYCKCGRKYPLIKKIVGRWTQEMLVGKQRNLISMTAINMHDDTYENTKQFQFYQEKPGQVILKIIKGAEYTERDSKRIISRLNEKLKDSIEIKIQLVENLTLTKSGKHRLIDQRTPIVCLLTSEREK
jgi:phenylacetate-CoA ligase